MHFGGLDEESAPGYEMESMFDDSYATNPGGLGLNPFLRLRYRPLWPLVWLSLLTISVLLASKSHWGWWVAVGVFVVLNGLYWYVAWMHFAQGNVNEAILISVEPPLMAVAVDMSTNFTPHVGLKVISYPKKTLNGRPLKQGSRHACATLYSGESERGNHWEDCDPIPLECGTWNRARISAHIQKVTNDEWQELDERVKRLARPYKPGLYPMWGIDDSSKPVH